MVPSSAFCDIRHLIDSFAANMYNFKGFLDMGGTSTSGSANTCLIYSNACHCSSPQMNSSWFFTFSKGEKAFILPIKWGFIALSCSGVGQPQILLLPYSNQLQSLFWCTKNPKNILVDTPNAHFARSMKPHFLQGLF